MKDDGTGEEDYRETLDYLFGLQRFGIKLGLDNITALLKDLGSPHLGLRAVHIAGSNGKGSTAAFLTFMLRAAGYRVGLYTSPHLVDFSERIQVDGKPVPTARVVSLTRQIRERVQAMAQAGELWPADRSRLPAHFDPQKATITFFEFTTALAFLYFREMKIDIAVVETGLGGRLDATNVLDPLLGLITSISLEHQQYLGNTIRKIAAEKAGIIKPRRPLLTSARHPSALALFRRKCRALQAPFYAWKKDFRALRKAPRVIDYQGRLHRWPGLNLGLAGGHQVVNASLAIAAVETLMENGWAIHEAQIREGLAQTKWPGRLELLAGDPPILLDGAHNPEAAKVLKKALLQDFPRRRLIMVLGIMADKDMGKMMAELVPLADRLILTRPRLDRAASLEVLRAHAAPLGKPFSEVADVGQAVEAALAEAGEGDLILVTGSLFNVGEARAHLMRKGRIKDEG